MPVYETSSGLADRIVSVPVSKEYAYLELTNAPGASVWETAVDEEMSYGNYLYELIVGGFKFDQMSEKTYVALYGGDRSAQRALRGLLSTNQTRNARRGTRIMPVHEIEPVEIEYDGIKFNLDIINTAIKPMGLELKVGRVRTGKKIERMRSVTESCGGPPYIDISNLDVGLLLYMNGEIIWRGWSSNLNEQLVGHHISGFFGRKGFKHSVTIGEGDRV
jgi:hypothetical protein